jgi:hypothetical protein
MKILFTLTLLLLSVFIKTDDCVNVYKLEKDTCGDLCLSKYIASFAVKFGGVKEGNCNNQGFTVFDHKETVSVGPFGSFDVTIYKKPVQQLELFLQ